MIRAVKISVSVDKIWLKYLDKLVRKREYKSRSHALDEALKLLRAKEDSFLERIRDGKL